MLVGDQLFKDAIKYTDGEIVVDGNYMDISI